MILISLLKLVRDDAKFRTTTRNFLNLWLSSPGFRCLILLRFQSLCYQSGYYKLSNYIRFRMLLRYSLDSVPGCIIGKGFKIEHPVGIVIGKGVVIGDFVTLAGNVTLGEKFIDSRSNGSYPRLGNRISVGSGAIILGNTFVGDDVTIGAGSIVLRSVNPGSTVVGLHK